MVVSVTVSLSLFLLGSTLATENQQPGSTVTSSQNHGNHANASKGHVQHPRRFLLAFVGNILFHGLPEQKFEVTVKPPVTTMRSTRPSSSSSPGIGPSKETTGITRPKETSTKRSSGVPGTTKVPYRDLPTTAIKKPLPSPIKCPFLPSRPQSDFFIGTMAVLKMAGEFFEWNSSKTVSSDGEGAHGQDNGSESVRRLIRFGNLNAPKGGLL